MSLQRKLNQRERMAYDTIARLEQERDALRAQVGTLTELHANALNKAAERDALRSKLAEREELLRKATSHVQRMVECAGSQPSVATGYLRDILELLNGNAEPSAPKCDGPHGGGRRPDPGCRNSASASIVSACNDRQDRQP